MNVSATVKTKEIYSYNHGHFITTLLNIKNEIKKFEFSERQNGGLLD